MNPPSKTSSIKIDDAPPSNSGSGPPQVLLVDDDPSFLNLNVEILTRAGYDVHTAADGAEAWQALQDCDYDLLITDYKMPRVTGLELIKKLRSEEMTLPVILASGTMPTEELNLHPWLQINATLPKPYSIAELLVTVKKVLGTLIPTPFADLMLNPEKLEAALAASAPPPVVGAASEPVREQLNLSYHILVVDDDPDLLLLSMDLLTASGYDVAGAKDGAAGWQALQATDFDLVVTDNKMPNLTGLEMIAKLRASRLPVPVIMATGELPLHEFARKPWLKPEAMLQRPFTNDDLLAVVSHVLGTDNGDESGKATLLPKYL
jgi:DNA-binding response OmpR family regulator